MFSLWSMLNSPLTAKVKHVYLYSKKKKDNICLKLGCAQREAGKVFAEFEIANYKLLQDQR